MLKNVRGKKDSLKSIFDFATLRMKKNMKYIFGNWKMYLNLDESTVLAEKLAKEKITNEKVSIAVFPTALSLAGVVKSLAGTAFSVGPQDVAWTPKGAYTGCVSALMYKDVGCKYALVGHSERRHIFKETDADVRKKIEACLDSGLIPVVCIGETKEEKESGKREYRLKRQLFDAFKDLNLNGGEVIVAYEPVWAIGTGQACNPADADDVHGWIKLELKQYIDKEIPVLYGGSVNLQNVLSYLALETVDGVLIGGASTKTETFLPIIEASEILA